MVENACQRDEIAFGIDHDLLHDMRAFFQKAAQQVGFARPAIALDEKPRREQFFDIDCYGCAVIVGTDLNGRGHQGRLSGLPETTKRNRGDYPEICRASIPSVRTKLWQSRKHGLFSGETSVSVQERVMKSFGWIALISALMAASPAMAQTSTKESAIDAVLKHHMAAFARKDAAEIMKDYADDVIMVFFDQIVQGKAAAFQTFQSHFVTPSNDHFKVGISKVVGDVGVLHWILNAGQTGAIEGDDVFVIRDGKIRFQTTANVKPYTAAAAH